MMRKPYLFVVALAALLGHAPLVAAQNNKALRNLESEIENRQARERALQQAARQVAGTRAKLQKRIVMLASDLQEMDRQRDRLERRLADMEELAAQFKRNLTRDRVALANTLAWLQMAERDAPPAYAVHPDDALDAVQGAIVLASIVPNLTQRATEIRHRLTELDTISARIADERHALTATERDAHRARADLQTMLKDKATQEAELRRKAARETDEIARLVKRARNMKELIARLGARADKQDGAQMGASQFTSARGLLPAPVAGAIHRRFGTRDKNGRAHRGMTFAARAGAHITSPYDGRILYSGRFRDYGEIVILGIDRDYNILLAGIGSGQTYVGQDILAGEPLGIMPENAVAVQRSRLYMEIRYKGRPIDPAPWMSRSDDARTG